ncbi:MAG: hypothetical protein GC178_11855 [Flavobacteriales bacterium]|nr:hypothetical protein [Flavobacteriales bacterium]
MRIILDIDSNNKEALALLAYIRSLQFVHITEEEFSDLSNEQRQAIDKGIESLKNGGLTQQEVMESTRLRFPHLFEKRA